MEHLPVPNNAIRKDPELVKYVCSKAYDGGPFLEYPVREGVGHALPLDGTIPGGSPFWLHESHDPTPNEELEDFFQRWLFFGLIHEILGDRYPDEELTRVVDGHHGPPKVLSTSRLVEILDAWVADAQAGRISRSPTYEHVSECLRLTFATLRAAGPKFDPTLKLCLASLGEIFAFAVNKAFDIMKSIRGNLCPVSWAVDVLIKDEYWSHKWLEAGWCPSHAHIDNTLQQTLQSRYYVSRLVQPNGAKGHQACTKVGCVAYQVNLGKYKTQHVSLDCSCHDIVIDPSALHAVYESGDIPLLRITEGETLADLSVELLTSSDEPKYTALSHVWADGLGNPTNNALPRCQLSLVNEYNRNLCEIADSQKLEPRCKLLWIDTLCCPTGPKEAKNAALAQMKRIYELACRVLVLDTSVRLYPTRDSDLSEAGIRIALSGWIRRLWTLQEGVLPASKQELWFQFRDGPVNLRLLVTRLVQAFNFSIGQRGLSMCVLTEINKIESFFENNPKLPGAPLSAIQTSLPNRSVSVPSDEPLLIANLLGLDIKEILDGPETTRMRRLWRAMPKVLRGIPRDIIFRVGPRLSDIGFRWAPATLLYNHPGDTVRHVNRFYDEQQQGQQGLPSNRGLDVELTGYSCRMPLNMSNLTPWKSVRPDEMNMLWSRSVKGEWYSLFRKAGPSEEDFLPRGTSTLRATLREESDLILLHEPVNLVARETRTDIDRQSTSCLLAQLVEDKQDTKYIKSLQHVTITLCPPDTALMLEAAFQAVGELSKTSLVQAMISQINAGGDTDSTNYTANVDTLKQELDRIVADTDEPVLKVAQQSSKDYGPRLYRALIAGILVGEYGCLGPRLPDTQRWCVD